jgi:hypothetical protein
VAGWRWTATVLCLAAAVAGPVHWASPPVRERLAFQGIADDRFSQLRRLAMAFVEARPHQGVRFVETRPGASLQIHCKGVPVLWLERRSQYLLLQASVAPGSGRPTLCSCGRFFNGSWSHWTLWSRCWLACRSLS